MLGRLFWIIAGFISGWLLDPRPQPSAPESTPDMDETTGPIDAAFTGMMESEAPGAETAAEFGAGPAGDVMAELGQLRDALAGLQAGLGALDKQWSRAGREQLKANTLAEAQQQQVQAAFEQLREQSARRESDLAALREQLWADQSAQRLLVIERILPALDGLDEALASGARLLERAPHSEPPAALPSLSARQRLAFALGRADLSSLVPAPARSQEAGSSDAWRAAFEAWLRGLELVRARLLDALAAEGVRPIDALGEPFDPHLHIAIDTVPATGDMEPGTIIAEHRRGYAYGERVLRPAEVAAAQAANNSTTMEVGRDNHE